MNTHRLWVIGSVILIVAVLGLGFLLGVQPQLSTIATANSARAEVEAGNALAELKLAALQQDFDNIDELKGELAALVASVPTGANAPELVDQLDALAKQVVVTLTGITVAEAQPYTPVTPAAPPVPAPAAEGATGESVAATEPAAPLAPPAGAPPVVSALITPANFAVQQVSVTITGGYAQVLDYVNGLQTGERLFLVTTLNTTAPSEADGTVDATIGGLVYAALTPDLIAAPAAG